MEVKTNPRLKRIIFIAVNAFALTITVASRFLGGNFLLIAAITFIVFNLGYLILQTKIGRLESIRLNESDNSLALKYVKTEDNQILNLREVNVVFETRHNSNGDDRKVLLIYQNDRPIELIWPGISGFAMDDLERLEAKFKELSSTTDGKG